MAVERFEDNEEVSFNAVAYVEGRQVAQAWGSTDAFAVEKVLSVLGPAPDVPRRIEFANLDDRKLVRDLIAESLQAAQLSPTSNVSLGVEQIQYRLKKAGYKAGAPTVRACAGRERVDEPAPRFLVHSFTQDRTYTSFYLRHPDTGVAASMIVGG